MKDFDIWPPSPQFLTLGALALTAAVLFHSPLSFIIWGAIRLGLLLACSWGAAFWINQKFKSNFWGWPVALMVFLYGWGLVI